MEDTFPSLRAQDGTWNRIFVSKCTSALPEATSRQMENLFSAASVNGALFTSYNCSHLPHSSLNPVEVGVGWGVVLGVRSTNLIMGRISISSSSHRTQHLQGSHNAIQITQSPFGDSAFQILSPFHCLPKKTSGCVEGWVHLTSWEWWKGCPSSTWMGPALFSGPAGLWGVVLHQPGPLSFRHWCCEHPRWNGGRTALHHTTLRWPCPVYSGFNTP